MPVAVGLSEPQHLLPVAGIELATTSAGIRYTGRDDMVLLTICEGANSAAVFTQNKFCAAPVVVAREHLLDTQPRALLINSGNANAGTGKPGLENTALSCKYVAGLLNIQAEQVMPFSTGVIGEQLPMDKIEAGVSALTEKLQSDNWLPAAHAIMTTDTVAKAVSESFEIDGQAVTITGIAKGSGMICPNMATMLAYVATDAKISQATLQAMLQRANLASFNRITVDGDTSTNDALVLIATGQRGVHIETDSEQAAQQFYSALQRVFVSLATAIVRDGDGASKFVKVTVSGAGNSLDAESIAYSVAHSPLVKTALFASDPNWGRILAAVGKAPVSVLEVEKVDIRVNDTAFIEQGEPARDYSEAIGKKIFQQTEIEIMIDLNQGAAEHHVWTSDLSHAYVSINADYRS